MHPPVAVDMKRVKARKDEVSGSSEKGVEAWLAGMKGCEIHRGHARFEGPRAVRVGGQLLNAERIFINVNGLYREFSGDTKPVSVMKVYEAMADWYWRWTSPAGCARRRMPRRSGSCVIPTGVARTSTS